MAYQRQSAVLMHITSLPSGEGIGTLGKCAYEFADFLKASGVSLWQMLPVGPAGSGNSPYQSPSTHAGNPLLIDLETLVRDDILDKMPENTQGDCRERVDFDRVKAYKEKALRRAFELSYEKLKDEIASFRAREDWVEDYALFEALKIHYNGAELNDWPDEDVRMRKPEAMAACRERFGRETDYYVFVQYLFDTQWEKFRTYCRKNGIRLLGDVPIYVAADSADVWVNPEVFRLDRDRRPMKVSGVPPDYFSEDGQLWGNPCYDWKKLRRTGYAWWIKRMRTMARRFDMVRMDHFIGFANYYAIDAGAPNARSGKWEKGPGKKLFRKLKAEIPQLEIVAEDLGILSARVIRLIRWTGYPGMKVLQFAFSSDLSNPYLPDQAGENSVYYTGTHDNNTAKGWWENASAAEKEMASKYLDTRDENETIRSMIRTVFMSRARIAAAPMQDFLGLDTRSRMNVPGVVSDDNWAWRMLTGAADKTLSESIAALNRESERGRTV